jgi:hypothetical protein
MKYIIKNNTKNEYLIKVIPHLEFITDISYAKLFDDETSAQKILNNIQKWQQELGYHTNDEFGIAYIPVPQDNKPMDINDLLKIIKDLKSYSHKCAEEWRECFWDKVRKQEDVHYCQDTCPIADICKDANIDTCGLVIDVLEALKSNNNGR